MIIVYTQKLDNAIKMSLSLGGISHRGKLLKEVTPLTLSEVEEDAKKNSYIRTSIGNDPAVFVWGDDLVRPCRMNEYPGISIEDGFYVNEIKFKMREENKAQLETVISIFQNETHHVIYDASIGTKGHTDFFCLYTYSKVKKDVRRIVLTSLEPDAIRSAFSDPLPIASTFKQSLRDNAYTYIYYLANCNIPLIFSKAYDMPFPKMKELPILDDIVRRNDEIEEEMAKNYFLLGLMITTSKGKQLVLRCKNAKFKTRKEAEDFAREIPAKTGIEISVALVEDYCKGPHSADSIEKEAEKLYKYKRMQTDLILSQLYNDGFISSESTKVRCFPEGSEGNVNRLLTLLKSTNAFCDILSPISEWKIPEDYFGDDRKSGILITKKNPDNTFRDPERRNIYYLICKEMIKPILGPRVLQKKTASIEYGGLKFSITGNELVQAGYSILDEKKEYKNEIPDELGNKDEVSVSYIIEPKIKSMPSQKKELDVISQFTKEKKSFLNPDEIRIMIDSLVNRKLIIRKYKLLLASKHASNLIHFARKFDGFIQMPYTWEKCLCEIEDENTSLDVAERLSQNIKVTACDAIKKWHSLANEIAGKKTLIPCPSCSEPLYSSSKEIYCKKCGFTSERLKYGRVITDEDFACLMKFGTTPLLKGFYPEGKEVRGRIYISKDNEILFTEDSTYLCPTCETHLRITDDESYSCPSCGFTLSRVIEGHKLKRDEFSALLTRKRTGLIEDFIDEDGVIYSGVIYLDPEDKNSVRILMVTDNET